MSARVTDSLPAGRREAERRGVQLETCTGSASLPDGAHIRVSLVFFSECNKRFPEAQNFIRSARPRIKPTIFGESTVELLMMLLHLTFCGLAGASEHVP